jgi:acyl carrier protein
MMNIKNTSIVRREDKMIFEKVKAIIVEQLGVDADEVTMESSFVENLGADSLDIVELIMSMEDQFKITIPDTEAENITTVGAAVKFIENNR